MNNIINNITQLLDSMISNIKAMGYSLYAVLAAIVLLLLLMLISRKHKWLVWILLILTAALSLAMLNYVIMGDQILLFFRLTNYLSSFSDFFLIVIGVSYLVVIVLVAIISLIVRRKRAVR